MSTKQTMQLY